MSNARLIVLRPDTTRFGGAVRASRRRGRPQWSGLLYLAPAALLYVLFMLVPIAQTVSTSFYQWDGITPGTWVGLDNYVRALTDGETLLALGRAFVFTIFYAILPILIGLLLAGTMSRTRIRFLSFFRTVLFLPQVLATVVVAVAWRSIYAEDGPLNDFLDFIGAGGYTRAWLGDFDTAFPAVGLIGTWVGYGLCMLLFLGGVQKIPHSLYEAARLDGAGPVREFFAVTMPSLRSEIRIALILTVTNSLRNFDIIWNTTHGGPGSTTTVPSYLIYHSAFVTHEVGLAAARAVALTVVILLVVGLISRLVKEERA